MISKKDLFVFYSVSFLISCVFIVPIWYFFFTNYLHFGLETAIFITVLSGFISMIFEVLSGAWADRYGRKKTYFLGLFFNIIAFSFYIFSESLELFIIGAIIGGFAMALTSGNIEAIIHDKLNGHEKIYQKIQATQYIYIFIGRGISSLLAGYIFLLNPLFPIYATIICYSIAILLFSLLSDKEQIISIEQSNKQHILQSISYLRKHSKSLYIIIFNGILLSGIGNVYWFTYQPFLEKLSFKIEEIGIIYFFLSIVSALGAFTIKKIDLTNQAFNTLKHMYLVLLLSAIGFHFFTGLYGLIPIFILSFCFGFVMSLGNSYLIAHSNKRHKSTVLSIFSLSIGIAYFSFSNIAGFFIDIYSLEKVYFSLIFIILGVIIIDNLYIRKKLNI